MSLEFEDGSIQLEDYDDNSHPLILYLQGDKDVRSEVLLNHPDVIGFIYLRENVVSKAFLQKRIIDFKSNDPATKKMIVAVSGDPDNFTSFSVSELEVLSDNCHLTDCTTLNKLTPVIQVGKYLKENKNKIPPLPTAFQSATKIKNLKAATFPLILPIVKRVCKVKKIGKQTR